MSIKSRSQRQELAMLLPAVIFLTALIVVPFALSIWFSFTDQRLVPRPIPTKVIGFTNYFRMFDDPLFWQAIWNTVLFALLVVPFQLAISLGAALILNAAIPFRSVFRAIAILPLAARLDRHWGSSDPALRLDEWDAAATPRPG